MKKKYLGILAELFVALVYLFKFYRILAWRYKARSGEIDLICKRVKRLVFIEVKARTTNFETSYFGPNQKRRIQNSAQLYMQRYLKYQDYDYRFDLVIVRPWKLPEIIENAW